MNCSIEMLTAIGDFLQGIGSVASAIAILVAAYLGTNSIAKWKAQKLEERKIEQAERILVATYNVRRSLGYVRNPAMWAYELNQAEERLKEAGLWDGTVSGSQKRLRTKTAYYDRLDAAADDRKKLEECQPMARALFSEELETALAQLNHQFHVVRVYVDAQAADDGTGNPELTRIIEGTVWAGYPDADSNPMDQKIKSEVKTIEDICVAVLRTATS